MVRRTTAYREHLMIWRSLLLFSYLARCFLSYLAPRRAPQLLKQLLRKKTDDEFFSVKNNHLVHFDDSEKDLKTRESDRV